MQRKDVFVSEEELKRQQEFVQQVRGLYAEKGKTPKALVETYGCQQNENDSERIKGMLSEMGLSLIHI